MHGQYFKDGLYYKEADAKSQRSYIELEKRKSCSHKFCCICCPCLPMWMRYLCCFGIIVILGLAVAAIVMAATFKLPQVDFNGVTDDPNGLPRFQKTNNSSTSFQIHVGLKFGVVNPNLESVTFENVKATAFYPTDPTLPVGGGDLSGLHIGSYTTTNFTFPFHLDYDSSRDNGMAMLLDISKKCGLTGGQKQDLTVNYILTPTIRIVGFPFSINIKNSATFPCPIENGQLNVPF